MTSNLSNWISGMRRKRSSRVDLRKSIVLKKKFKVHKKFIAIIGDNETGRNTLVRRFADIYGGPFPQPEIFKLPYSSAMVDLSKRPSFAAREIVNLRAFIFNFQQLDFQTLHETLSRLKSTAVVFDVACRNTLNTAMQCMSKISEFLGKKAPMFILIGNKIDLPEREVSTEWGKEVAEKYGAQRYYECSALMNTQVDEVLDAFLFMALYWRIW